MIRVEIILLTNNIVLPFQNLQKTDGLSFIELNKQIAIKSLAEHGLGFLINVWDVNDNLSESKLIKKLIFDTGSTNLTFLHNLDIRGYNIYDVDYIILSHWHYDHFGALYEILKRIDKKISIISHQNAKFERFFRRAQDIKNLDLVSKLRKDIIPLLNSSKIVNQETIDIPRIKELNGSIIFTENTFKILNNEALKVIISGEIPRVYKEEDFDNFYSLQNDLINIDKILDDKCIIFEFSNHVVLLNGCCHSGIMNTMDYVRNLTHKPISHIIGGFHMVNASQERILSTIEYLNNFQNEFMYLFPIHCSGDRFLKNIRDKCNSHIKVFDVSVGTIFNFNLL